MDSTSPTTRVFFDIETIPDQTEGAKERARSRVKVPGNYTKADTIEKFMAENSEVEYLRSSLDGSYGHIVAISYGINLSPITVLAPNSAAFERAAASGESFDFVGFEGRLLTKFWDALSTAIAPATRVQWVGHYITDFDLPFMLKRSIIHRKPPITQFPRNPKPWSNEVYDTRMEWTGDRTKHIKLDELGRVLGIDISKYEGMDGSEVWSAVQEGRIRDLGLYCKRDTQLARAIFYAMHYMTDVPEEQERFSAASGPV
jgi:3'-5' exonuclease